MDKAEIINNKINNYFNKQAQTFHVYKLKASYAGLLSGPFIVIMPYKKTNSPTNDGIRSQAVY